MSFNNLPIYRKAIYKLIDLEYDCDWYVEDRNMNVKTFDETELKRVTKLSILKIGGFYWEKGLLSLLFKDYDIYFILGSTRNISLFLFCFLKKIFQRRKKIYFWTHGFYGKESKAELLFWKRPLFRMPDGLFTYGDYAKKIMVEDGFDEKRIFPIHNSLDYDTQLALRKNLKPSNFYNKHFGNGNPVIIFIGRLTKIKQLDMLIDAVTLLKKKGEQYNIVLVGDGTERAMLEDKVRKGGLTDHVWFYGACYDEKDNAELVYNADLCVAPGNIGLTAMHVMMFGCPAVSHDNYSLQMPEFEAIRPNETGVFYKYGSVQSLAETISKWFACHSNDREAVRKACYKEIDTNWNPYYQIEMVKKNLK